MVVHPKPIEIIWDQLPARADSINIRRREEGGSFTQIDTIADPTVTSYTDSSLTAGDQTVYEYDVIGVDNDSSNVTASGLNKLQNDKEYVVLSWEQLDGAAAYQISRDGSVIANPGGSVTRYVDHGTTVGVQHSYSIRGFSIDSGRFGSSATATISSPIKKFGSFGRLTAGRAQVFEPNPALRLVELQFDVRVA